MTDDQKIQPALSERWLPVVGYEGYYEVSDIGNVRRVLRPDSLGRPRRCGVLRNALDRGYHRVSLSKNDKPKGFAVHRLVAAAFLGPPPSPAHVVNHKDGVKANNRPSNLEYLTSAENTRHAVRLGLHAAGDRHGMAKSSETQRDAICREWKQGMSITRLAAVSGLSETRVSRMVRRKVRLVG